LVNYDLVLLTYERMEVVERTLQYNLANAGKQIDHLIHVDNGSKQDLVSMVCNVVSEHRAAVKEFTQIRFEQNKGVSYGYNTGIVAGRGDFVIFNGCDWYMPDNWLKTYDEYIEAIPNTGGACMLQLPLKHPDMAPLRLGASSERKLYNGKEIEPCLLFSRRCVRRDLYRKAGYFREDFLPYGYEDNEWHQRAWTEANANDWVNYNIPDCMPVDADTPKDREKYEKYWNWKKECRIKGAEIMKTVEQAGFPHYSPY